MLKRFGAFICALGMLCAAVFPALGEVMITITDPDGEETHMEFLTETVEPEEALDEEAEASEAREAFIDDILALAKEKYDEANGRARRAQYAGDIYVCKNFTVYLFKENAHKYRMAEYPDVKLVIPDNLPKDQCVEYVYGMEWKDVAAEDGNPFYAAAEFRYDPAKSKEENWEDARAFLKQVRRGDYFQMAANYYYGIGAHSMIFSADYDPETDTVTWCDSNMKGEKRNGERYGYVQFDAVKEIDWFVDAFCRKKYGATIYRLRDDIIYAE
ncbi:MAG: hypothetical protein J6K55_03235 [Clostridia bacterium]|nr:hypothetical protein [Clostridia bacterium]